MREILFKGKNPYGRWIEGSLVCKTDSMYGVKTYSIVAQDRGSNGLLNPTLSWYPVKSESIGQYTEITDANGKRIFEGDIVRIESGTFEFTGQVVFEQGCFQLVDPECDVYECLWYQPDEMTVLGNIHDNKELLGVEG